jgi:CelD/BcsL family acetyltransferase involved in cellulose biosynthesis
MVRVADEFSSLAESWSDLLGRSDSDIVCLTPEWISSWWEAFGKGNRPFVLTVWHDEILVGLAPMMMGNVSILGVPTRRLQFMANGHSPRADIITDSSFKRPALRAIFVYLNMHRKLWDFIELSRIPRETGTVEVLGDVLADVPLKHNIHPSAGSPYIPVETDWETFYAGRSAKFRKVMRNKLNRVKRLGESVAEQLQDEKSLRSSLPTVFELSDRSWKGKHNSGIGSTPANRAFYRGLVERAGPRGWLSIWILRIGGEPVAFECDLLYGDKAYALSSDFDEAYRDSTPGSVLERFIIERYFRAGLKEYDMCGADYSYKLKWTSKVREHADVSIYHSGPTSQLWRFWRHTMLPRLRSSRTLRSFKDRWNFQKRNGSRGE